MTQTGRTGKFPWSVASRWQCVFAVATVATVLLGLSTGASPFSLGATLRFIVASCGFDCMPRAEFDALQNIIVDIRVPRVATALLVGSCLSVSGASFQAVFQNPLVSPSLMGVQAGAAFGAALGMLWSGSWYTIQLLAFAMGLLAVAVGVAIATIFDRKALVMLVLGGIVSTALFSSLLSMIKYVADPLNVLPSIVYWLMGNLAAASLDQVKWFAIPMILGLIALSALGRALDAVAMGDDEALSLGVSVKFIRYGVVALATLMSALTVSLAGVIGWVGLIVPHVVRLLVGPLNRSLLPACALCGGAFMVLCDCAVRVTFASKLPIGVVTELLGIPMFVLVLRRAKRGWA